jgi:hypothetical protein
MCVPTCMCTQHKGMDHSEGCVGYCRSHNYSTNHLIYVDYSKVHHDLDNGKMF